MNRDAAAAQALSWRPLAPAAVDHLAHELRGAIHVIRGHAELLGPEATPAEIRESAGYIAGAGLRLNGLCEDIIDFLRLPGIAPGAPVPLAIDDVSLLVHPSVRRVVVHVIEHVVRSTAEAVTVAATRGVSSATCAITVAPVPSGLADRDDGIVALAAELLSARGGDLTIGHGVLRVVVQGAGEE